MFKPAVKHESKLRLAIAGPSGAGKTYTALNVATAMGGKVALVDTEHGSASKYADLFAFDVVNLDPPYHPHRFVEAIRAAEQAGYDVLIIDSLSHAWNGPGGVLEIVDLASRKFKGNTYAGWQEGTPAHNMLIEGIVGAKIHIIGTMRSKQEYVLQTDNRGKQVPQKVGMAPVQRDGFEYEFDIYLDMDVENNAIVSKTRCPALTGRVLPKPGADLAGILAEWLQGEPTPAAPKPVQKQAPPPQQASNGKPLRLSDQEADALADVILRDSDREHDPFPDDAPENYPPGTPVVVRGEHDEKPGTITEGPLPDGRYKVKVDGKTATVSPSRLTLVPAANGDPQQGALLPGNQYDHEAS